jgi:hypothetical protein
MMSHPFPPRWDYHSDGTLSQTSSFPNFHAPLPLFPSSLDSQYLPLTASLRVLSPLHNDSSFPLWSSVAPPPNPKMIGGAFNAFVADDGGASDGGDYDVDGATPAAALSLSSLASTTLSSTPISRGPLAGPGTAGPVLGHTWGGRLKAPRFRITKIPTGRETVESPSPPPHHRNPF